MPLPYKASSLFQIHFLLRVVSNKHCRLIFAAFKLTQNVCVDLQRESLSGPRESANAVLLRNQSLPSSADYAAKCNNWTANGGMR
jgi:hypothetical protein